MGSQSLWKKGCPGLCWPPPTGSSRGTPHSALSLPSSLASLDTPGLAEMTSVTQVVLSRARGSRQVEFGEDGESWKAPKSPALCPSAQTPSQSPQSVCRWPPQCSRLEDPMDRGAGQTAVHGVAEPDTTEWLSTQVAPGLEGNVQRADHPPSLVVAFAPS